MRTSSRRSILLAVLMAGLFLFGLFKLFVLRFEQGDVYPPYSTLRSDPLGTKALYTSLEYLVGDNLRRNYGGLPRLTPEANTTFLYLGASGREWELNQEAPIGTLEQMAGKGGRIVISFTSATGFLAGSDLAGEERSGDQGREADTDPEAGDTETQAGPREGRGSRESACDGADPEGDCEAENIFRRWGLRLAHNYDKAPEEAVYSAAEGSLESPISWHTSRVFSELDTKWRRIYTCNDHPVVIERDFDGGTIVLSADSYIFSNEAMRNHRYPELLAWVLGDQNEIVFDESHLGVRRDLGIADLARRYRLYWLLFAFVVFAGLYVWKNASYFVPPLVDQAGEATDGINSSRDYKEGLISLLRRNLRTRDILGICLTEWEKSFRTAGGFPTDRTEGLTKARGIVDSEGGKKGKVRDLARAYRQICGILSERNQI